MPDIMLIRNDVIRGFSYQCVRDDRDLAIPTAS
jgi:hypothetical protein